MKPDKFNAVKELVGGQLSCIGDEFTFHDGQTEPTKEEIQAKLKELEKQYADNDYQRKRLEEYNAIGLGEQFDMIYHDMDGWKKRIKAIKDKYPKPK